MWKRRINTRLSPRNWVYLLLQLVLILVGVILLRADNAALTSVGSGLLATGVAGGVLFVWVMVNQEQARRLELLTRLGLVDGFPERSTRIKEHYDRRLANAKQAIDIMGFGLRQLREDYSSDFTSWASRARVRILLIDPNAPGQPPTYAAQRDKEERNAQGSIRTDVESFLRETESARRTAPDRFELKLYTALPSINIFRIDDELFWGPYLLHQQSRNAPTFVVQRGGCLFDQMMSHFEEMWNDTSFSRVP